MSDEDLYGHIAEELIVREFNRLCELAALRATPTEEPDDPTMCARCGTATGNAGRERCRQCGDCLTCGVGYDAHGVGCPHAATTEESDDE